jgi:hypothetical protein
MLARLLGWLRGSGDAVYWYHDGRKWLKADPLAVGRELETLLPDYGSYLELLTGDTPPLPGAIGDDLERQKKEALGKLVDVSRKLFSLKTVAEGGRTDAGAFRVFVDWLLEMGRMGEEARPFLNSRQRDAPSISPDSLSES